MTDEKPRQVIPDRVAFMLSIGALLLSLIALLQSTRLRDMEARLEQRVYDPILSEVWQEVQPAYRDFDLNAKSPPESFRDLLPSLLPIDSRVESD